MSSASRDAVAAFSILTGRSISVSSIFFRSKSGQCRLGANTSRCDTGSTRPGRLTPMPSVEWRGRAARILRMHSIMSRVEARGSEVSGTSERESRRPLRSTTATVAWRGWMSAAMATRSSLSPMRVGRRPRGAEATGPFAHPVFTNQLLDNLRNGAALQAGAARQVGTGDGLAGADQLENDVAVDAPRGFAGSQLQIAQIDMANAAHAFSMGARRGNPATATAGAGPSLSFSANPARALRRSRIHSTPNNAGTRWSGQVFFGEESPSAAPALLVTTPARQKLPTRRIFPVIRTRFPRRRRAGLGYGGPDEVEWFC